MARVDAYELPDDLWYDPREHLWLLPARVEAGWLVTIGVDALGQEALGQVVYIQLVEPGRAVNRGDALGTLEAEKMVRPVLAPVSGLVTEVNRAVLAAPGLLNREPYGQGWLLRLRAGSWEVERDQLLHGEAPVTAWARAELGAAQEGR
jgi:glycine cleavage system H protein